ncbi:MAG TPA: hypothetical protein VI753_08355 [Anaerolineales bacterium]|nr:hypothetical protein [Anaerolineales bacterium]
MAKITLNPVVQRIQGKMGNAVFRLAHTGQMTITKLPDMSKVKWSKAQKDHRHRFKQAVAYARAAMDEPKVRAVYEKIAAQKHKRPFDRAVSDYFKGNDLISKK